MSPTRSQCEQFPRFCEPVTKEKVQSGRAFRAIDCQIGELKNCIFLEVIAIILKKRKKRFHFVLCTAAIDIVRVIHTCTFPLLTEKKNCDYNPNILFGANRKRNLFL